MGYQLGIDFGTTFTSAVVRRADGAGEPEVVPLGGRGGAVSSVLHLARDERVTVGEAAAGLAGIDPTRVVRALKRHVGDPDPVVLGGYTWTAEDLSARLLRWVVDRVAEQEGGPPSRIALAHPPSWGAHTLERLAAALAGQDLAVTFVAEPHAVADAAAGTAAPGDTIAIHDLGGGRFDAAVLRREGSSAGGFATLGVPETIADLGGLDLDDLVWEHVRARLSDDVPPVARVRRACTRAKETLSAEDEVVVRIRRGELRGAVRLDRVTFEKLITPHVDRTVAALARTIASAGLEPAQLAALLLVGGSARIPLVARTVTEQLGCVPTVHGAADLVARGAVLALAAPHATVETDALDSTRSGYVAVRSTADPVVEDNAEAPTVVLAVPAAADVPTAPFGTPVVVRPVAVDPEVDPEVDAAAAPDAASTPVPVPRRSAGRGRTAAVLDPGTRKAGRRSLARTLVGVGAVIVAVLVLVALFRPDGPLDPPLDPVADEAASRSAVRLPAAVAPPLGTAVPPAADVRTDPQAGQPTAAVRPAADPRPSVTTTPPAVPQAASSDVLPTPGRGPGGPRTGVTPPTPVAPVM